MKLEEDGDGLDMLSESQHLVSSDMLSPGIFKGNKEEAAQETPGEGT